MNYGINLKTLRQLKNYTQQDIANILGIARGLYSQYEIEDKIIPLHQLNKLCEIYNVSIDYCLGLTYEKNYKKNTHSINQELFCKRLKELRKENRITQTELAQTLNTTHSVISSYEHGKTLILTSFLYAICKNYNISADYLLGKTDAPKNINK